MIPKKYSSDAETPQWVQQSIVYHDKLHVYAGETWYEVGERGILREAQLTPELAIEFAKQVKSGRIPLPPKDSTS